MSQFDVSCSKCSLWCNVDKCYRSKEYLPQVNSPSFNEYRNNAQDELTKIMNDPDTLTKEGIKALDAGLSSGKSHQTMSKSLELAQDTNVAIFTPTHAAGGDIINQIHEISADIAPNTIVCHVYGKREETCLPNKWEKQTPCAQCPIFKKFTMSAKSDDDKEIKAAKEAQRRRIGIIMECKGKSFDLKELQDVAQKYGACASVISKILAHAEDLGDETSHAVLAVLPHSYLVNEQYQQFILKINPAYVFVDEADLIQEMLLSTHQESLTIAETRHRPDQPYTTACNFDCGNCRPHFADNFGTQIEVLRNIGTTAAYENIGQPKHFIEFIQASIAEVVQLVDKGEIKDNIFDFDAIYRNVKKIEEVLSIVPRGELTPWKYFDTLQRTLETKSVEGVALVKLSEGLTITETNEYGHQVEKEIRPPVYVASIEVEPCITANGSEPFVESDDDIVPDTPVPCELRLSVLYPNRNQRDELKDTDNEKAIKTLMEFVNFCDSSGGQVGMYFELRSQLSDVVNETVEDDDPLDIPEPSYKRGGVRFCGIRLRHLNVLSYRQVVDFLQTRKTLMLSGTFLNHQLLAESLLLSPDEIDYLDVRMPLHKSALIIHHNPQFGRFAPDGISLAAFGNKHLAELTRRIVELRGGTKILNFETNARQGNVLYNGLSKDQQNSHLWVQNECNPRLIIPNWCSPDVTKDKFDNWFFIDKLRSSTARAVNRGEFDVSVVHGNGYFDWYDYLPFVHAIKQTVNPDTDLDTHIEYNRQRAVLQALLRTPRDENPTVCLYLSGDMSHLDYPDDLKGRVVTTNQLLKMLAEKYPDKFICNRDNQIELLAQVIAGFLDGNVTRDDISAAIEEFEFNGKYTGGKREARKETVDLSTLSDVHRYLVKLWIEVHKDSSDHARIIKTAIERLKHVDRCIDEKGYVDITKDRKGKIPDWRKWIDFLVEKEYLKSEKRKGSGKKPKIVYVRS